MEKTNYKILYENLQKDYAELKDEFIKINNELYYIHVSRSYKLVLILRKLISLLRKIKVKLYNLKDKFNHINKFIKNSKKIAIVPCSFEFDEFVNQRPINYAKFLSDNNYKVLYIVWQWDRKTEIKNKFKKVYKNVLQIPLYDFLDSKINYKSETTKIFYINFPHEIFSKLSYELRSKGFLIHYDIMDEWEEFKKVGQADWYKKNIEEKVILESDYVTAVSPYLVNKFKYIRTDINLSPNGYYKQVTGYKNENISLKTIQDGIINIGYFGHLTDAWFNWDLLFDISRKNKNYVFHIIGYGLSTDTQNKINKFENIKYYGKVPTNLLYKYVKNWNIGIILFKESNLSKAVDPIKIYEYLFMGLPVIVSGIEHLKSYPKTDLVKNSNEFSKCVDNIIMNKNTQDINKFLDNSTWEARFLNFLDNYNKKGMNKFYEK